MKRKMALLILLAVFLIGASESYGQNGFFLGIQAGYSAQKPSLTGIEFDTNTSFLYGVRAGIKFMMISVEGNYFQAAHNMELSQLVVFDWANRQVDYNYVGINLKYFFPITLLQPYLTVGYGYYTANIHNIDKDTHKGYSLGLGLEVHFGGKISLLAEGKYHRVSLDIDNRDLKLGNFTITGGISYYF